MKRFIVVILLCCFPYFVNAQETFKIYANDKLVGTAPKGKEVTLKATQSSGWVHIKWTGDCASAGSSPECKLVVNKEIHAYTQEGLPMTLTATPDKGSKFVKWTGDYCAGSTNPQCSFILEKNTKINAEFGKMPKPLWRKLF